LNINRNATEPPSTCRSPRGEPRTRVVVSVRLFLQRFHGLSKVITALVAISIVSLPLFASAAGGNTSSILYTATANQPRWDVSKSSGLTGNYSDKFGAAWSMHESYDPDTIEEDLEKSVEMGVKWARVYFFWSELEPVQGQWDMNGLLPLRDRIIKGLNDRGIKVLGVMYGTPSWANGGKGWTSPPLLPQFGPQLDAYARRVAERYDGDASDDTAAGGLCKGVVSAYEVWSEQNTDFWWSAPRDSTGAVVPGYDRAAHYTELLGHVSARIKAASPNAKVVFGGVTTGDPVSPPGGTPGLAFINQCLARNAAGYVDAVSFHPYRATPGEEVFRTWVNNLRTSINNNNPTKKPVDIWVTEHGWCAGAVPNDTYQAAYVLRSAISFADSEVKHYNLYCLREDYSFTPRGGAMLSTFAKQKLYYYYRCLAEIIGRAVSSRRYVNGDASFDALSSVRCSYAWRLPTLELHCFKLDDGGLAVAAWKRDDPAPDKLSFTVNDKSLGGPVLIDPENGRASPCPFITTGGKKRVENLALAGKPNVPAILVFPPSAPSPIVTSIAPTGATPEEAACARQGTAQTVELYGVGLMSGAEVRFESGDTTFNASSVKSISPSKMSCAVDLSGKPAGKYNAVVTNPDGKQDGLYNGFWVVSPGISLSSVAPSEGTAPTKATSNLFNMGWKMEVTNLSGTGFTPSVPGGAAMKVRLEKAGRAPVEAKDVGVNSSQRIRCNFDLAGAEAGKWDVVVTGNDGKSARLPGAFTVYGPATINEISPCFGDNVGPVQVKVTGTNFRSDARVQLIYLFYLLVPEPIIAATGVTVVSPTEIICSLDLKGARGGCWFPVVTHSDGYSVNSDGDADNDGKAAFTMFVVW